MVEIPNMKNIEKRLSDLEKAGSSGKAIDDLAVHVGKDVSKLEERIAALESRVDLLTRQSRTY